VHLTASRRFGGKERQILELARHLPGSVCSYVLLFREDGFATEFAEQLALAGIPHKMLDYDMPHWNRAVGEVAAYLRSLPAAVVCCHDYKSDVFGYLAARRSSTTPVAISHGWTGESLKVRMYEAVDRRFLRRMERVVCVSQGQADKVLRAGVPQSRVSVIHDAVSAQRFSQPDPAFAGRLRNLFPDPPKQVVGAAGRLSPEKGFEILVDAASRVSADLPDVGFVLFGDGILHERLASAVRSRGLQDRFLLAGHSQELDLYLPHFDLFALPSYTEGLPNVVLESFAAAVPVVATSVGGTPELVADGDCGFLVPPGDPQALAGRIVDLCIAPDQRREMGLRGRQRVLEEFTFDLQSQRYMDLFSSLGVVPCPA
jgi:glycosyltransferase involved in cell wall biosynthesis